ncbi:aminotransferase class V-fold PLP-dependent enzyme [Flavobacterium sp. CS20]|uniref:aminotransferase class V-fold PLP-dependent enzyme n=1 Tax=Flavobacterium sp. CS20 TaxID=2775246 RepID=UPI001B3A1D9A|nr:aminotransferase class V-fold PLP-dependent enzyme [Flavobacterium sp. CS20]QTY26276.1 aminotransferase class V-fold PLP-dependent enzyme [Flavobacterium sp. CS20]
MNTKTIFPQTQNFTYLNTATCGLLSINVLLQKQKDNEDFYNQGSVFLNDEDKIITLTKKNIARIFNVDQDKVAISANFSLAFNAVLDAINESATFLYLNEDYPSIRLPIKNRGFDCKSISITSQIENDIYEYIAKYKPNFFAVSKVQYLSGLHLETSFFQKLKRDFPNLKILVDGTQYLGVEAYDFKNSGIDLMISSGYKWLNAGLGNCIVMLSEALLDELNPKQIGANSLIDKTKEASKPMGFLEPGHYDLIAIKSLATALELHYNQIGIENIQNHLQNISRQAFETFKNQQLIDEVVSKRSQHSTIFNLSINQKRFQDFEKANISLSKRGNGLRVSFHYHNDLEDLDQLLKIVNN